MERDREKKNKQIEEKQSNTKNQTLNTISFRLAFF